MSTYKIAQVKKTYDGTSAQVWDALVNPVKVKQYFFGTDMESSWEVGDYIYFRGEYNDKAYEDKGIITDFEQEKLLAYNYRSSWSQTEDTPENYLPVRFELESSGGNTTLTITQSCFTEEEAKDSEKNWKQAMEQMQEVI
ncbi:MAG: SRPBCC domain-containing protein [Patescibacteria group bacterium]